LISPTNATATIHTRANPGPKEEHENWTEDIFDLKANLGETDMERNFTAETTQSDDINEEDGLDGSIPAPTDTTTLSSTPAVPSQLDAPPSTTPTTTTTTTTTSVTTTTTPRATTPTMNIPSVVWASAMMTTASLPQSCKQILDEHPSAATGEYSIQVIHNLCFYYQ
jgi:hypothetical protein